MMKSGNKISDGKQHGGYKTARKHQMILFSFAEYPVACHGYEGEENPPKPWRRRVGASENSAKMPRGLPRGASLAALLALLVFPGRAFSQESFQILDGFAKVINIKGINSNYQDYRGSFQTGIILNKQDNVVEWLTESAIASKDTVFVFTGGSHKAGYCRLFVNDKPALLFSRYPAEESAKDIVSTIWFGPECRMLFDYHGYSNGHAGVYYLFVPGSWIKAGEPAKIRVEPVTGPGDAWFGLSQRTDTLKCESGQDKNKDGTNDLKEAISLLARTDLQTPAEYPEALGTKIEAKVTVPESVGGEITVEARLRIPPKNEFETQFGKVKYVNEATTETTQDAIRVPQNGEQISGRKPRVPAVFEYLNMNPGNGVYIVNCLVQNKDGRVLELERAIKMGADIQRFIGPPSNVKLRNGMLNQYEMLVRPEPVTPHIPWANPCPGRPVKALFLMPGSDGRVVSELIQRMGLEARALQTGHYDAQVKDSFGAVEEFLKFNPELLVVNNTRTWGYIPAENKKRIFERVAQGMGLIIVWATEEPLVGAKDAPLAPVTDAALYSFIFSSPSFKDAVIYKGYDQPDQLAHFYTLGRGRIVLLHAESGTRYAGGWQDKRKAAGIIPPYLPLRPDEGEPWEYHYIFAIRAILWAANREPAITIGALDIEQDASGATITMQNKGGAVEASLETIVKNDYAEEESKLSQPSRIAAGENKIKIALPKLDPGRHWLNIIVRDKNKSSLGFGASQFFVSSPVKIAGLNLDREYYTPTQPVKVSARIFSETAGPAKCRWKVMDTYNRLLAESEQDIALVKGSEQELSCEFNLHSPIACLHTVWLKIEKDGQCLARQSEEFTVVRPDLCDDYQVKIWGGVPDYHYYGLLLDQLVSQGVDAILVGGNRGDEFINPNRIIARFRAGALHNMRVDPINMGQMLNGGAPKPDELERSNCVNKPEMREEYVRQSEFWADMGKRYAPCTYLLGDEMHYAAAKGKVHYNWCMCQYCLPKFRAYLKGQYGDIKKLNAEWETDCKNWDEVMPMTWDKAAGRGNYAPWLDHRIFTENAYMDIRTIFSRTIRKTDPYARIGLSGFWHPNIWTAENWPRTMAAGALTGWSPYWFMDNESLWVTQFYTGQEKQRIQSWVGYTFQNHKALIQVSPFYGFNGSGIYSASEFFEANFEPGELMLNIKDDIKEQKAGLVKLLMNTSRPFGPVATHFPERAGVMIDAVQGISDLLPFRDSMPAAVKGYGLWPQVVAGEQVEKGVLSERKTRALLTGYLPAVSDLELQQLEQFVKDGGVLTVCYRFGIFDEHGKPRDSAILEKFTGVKVVNPAYKADDLVKIETQPIVPAPDGQFSKLTGLSLNVYKESKEPDLHRLEALEGSVAAKFRDGPLAGQPAIVRHAYGNGAVYYINGFMQASSARENSVADDRLQPNRASSHRIIRTILEQAGIMPDLTPKTSGEWYEGITVARFQQGHADYFCFSSEPSSGKFESKDVIFQFPALRHFYEVKSGKYFEKTDTIKLPVTRPTHYVFAALPYRIGGLAVKETNLSARHGEQVSITFLLQKHEAAPWVDHVVHVVVKDASGKERPGYGANILCKDGVGVFKLPLALNDPPGDWKIEAKELASGLKTATALAVKEEKSER